MVCLCLGALMAPAQKLSVITQSKEIDSLFHKQYPFLKKLIRADSVEINWSDLNMTVYVNQCDPKEYMPKIRLFFQHMRQLYKMKRLRLFDIYISTDNNVVYYSHATLNKKKIHTFRIPVSKLR